MAMAIRPVNAIVVVGLSETNTIGYITLVGGQREGFSHGFLQINMIKSVEKVRGYCNQYHSRTGCDDKRRIVEIK